jgi:hypothetical protein
MEIAILRQQSDYQKEVLRQWAEYQRKQAEHRRGKDEYCANARAQQQAFALSKLK